MPGGRVLALGRDVGSGVGRPLCRSAGPAEVHTDPAQAAQPLSRARGTAHFLSASQERQTHSGSRAGAPVRCIVAVRWTHRASPRPATAVTRVTRAATYQARGWAWSCTARNRDTATWVYSCVVARLECPSSS